MDYTNLNRLMMAAPNNTIRDFNDRISGIDNLLFFNIGEPDFPTPKKVKDALIASVEHDQSFYSHSRGVLELRQAIADYCQRKFKATYDPESEILVTAGSTEALFLAVNVVTNPGDKVLVVDPNYVIYNSQVMMADCQIEPIEVEHTQFKLTPQGVHDKMAEIGEAKAIILNFPTNPTGATYSREELEALATVFREYNLYVISDEVYSEYVYDGEHVSIAEFIPERTLLINGTSKGFAMTGWRCGFLAAPEPIITACYALHQATITAVTTQVQYASIVAYRDCDEEVKQMRQSYDERRQLVMQGLDQLGWEYVRPEGAFYLFFKVPEWYQGTDVDFCVEAAETIRCALTPGSVFGNGGQQCVRISYASKKENLQILIDRLGQFQAKYQK